MWTTNLFLYRDMSVYLLEPHPKRRAGQSFSNCGLKITHFVWEWTSSLSGSVNRRINREWQRFSLSNMQRKKGSKRIEMIIKMVNEFKLTVVPISHFESSSLTAHAGLTRRVKGNEDAGYEGDRRPFRTPKPDADLCTRVDLPLDQKTVENQDWATGPLGRRAAGRRGLRGPLGRGPAFSKTPLKWWCPIYSINQWKGKLQHFLNC